MFSKTSFLISILSVCFFNAYSQLIDLEEKKPSLIDGIEYSYIIKNEQTKSSKGEEYSRFELTLYATNKSGCTKIFRDRTTIFSSESPNLIATYNCTNANGKRLTSKSGTVKARDFYVNVKVRIDGKETIQSVKIGYAFRNGETIKNNIIVLVPLGDRPIINCSINSLPELE